MQRLTSTLYQQQSALGPSPSSRGPSFVDQQEEQTPLPQETASNGQEASRRSSSEILNVEDSDGEEKASSNSTQFEAVSAKNSKQSASERSSKSNSILLKQKNDTNLKAELNN